jgi:hypothetical protein
LAAFSSYILALGKKFVQKMRAFNVDEIETFWLRNAALDNISQEQSRDPLFDCQNLY